MFLFALLLHDAAPMFHDDSKMTQFGKIYTNLRQKSRDLRPEAIGDAKNRRMHFVGRMAPTS